MNSMNIYEALKSGADANELYKAFNKELKDAKTRITAEQAAEKARAEQKARAEKIREEAHERYLNDCRIDLADAIIDYIETFMDEDIDEFTTESVVKMIKEAEDSLKQVLNLRQQIDQMFEDSAKSTNAKPAEKATTTANQANRANDDDILAAFLKGLK